MEYIITTKNHQLESSIWAFSIKTLTAHEYKGGMVTEQHADPIFKKVVLVVDEAIRYDFFEKLLSKEARKLNAIDFGEASSISPCSASSNAVLRWGFSIDRHFTAGKDPRENPKIWKYAKAAGFKTHLLDGQAHGFPQNCIGRDELLDIDDFQPSKSGIDTDKILAKKINSLLQRDSRDFIYVVKRGAHFEYEDNYQADMRSGIKTRSGNFTAAIRYSTSGFFTEILSGVNMNQTLIIYTSDHGQRLDGSGAPHCNSIPMLVFTDKPLWRKELGQASNAYRNKTSHLQIFATLLAGLGYDRSQIAKKVLPSFI